ncbi:hypothetical protein EVG20_g11407 [Dentipellis fragilis]|uniref:Uncharacterized protein n=1 Tax=Dentipellis fragilis TaxID=205917 RepID=A0A4Y9XKW5_9AGAM|nr:hypothetical protein EVG20_g11407 [Dentipellis fragilis]
MTTTRKAIKLNWHLGVADDQSIRGFFTRIGETAPDTAAKPILSSSSRLMQYKTSKENIDYKKLNTYFPSEHNLLRITESAEYPDLQAKQLSVLNRTDPLVPCLGLHGRPDYNEYIHRTHTRSLGGVSPAFRARVARQCFPYKPFPPLKMKAAGPNQVPLNADHEDEMDSEEEDVGIENVDSTTSARTLKVEVPVDGNTQTSSQSWSEKEIRRMDTNLRAFSRWEVHYEDRCVRSSMCTRLALAETKTCEACAKVAEDVSFKSAVRRKAAEARLPAKEQTKKKLQREKFAPAMFILGDVRRPL